MHWDDDENEQEIENQTKKSIRHKDDDGSGSDEGKRKVRTPKQKLNDLIREKYRKIKSAISNSNFVLVHQNLEELFKHEAKIFQLFSKDEFPLLFLEALCFIEESVNISKEDQKKLKRENNIALNNIKKSLNKNLEKKNLSDLLAPFKEKRPTEDEIDEALKSETESEESESDGDEKEEIDIIALMKMDEGKEPAQRRLKWVKKKVEKKPTEEEKETVKKPKKQIVKTKQEEEPEMETVKEKITDDKIEKECEEISNQRGQSKRPIETVSRLDFLFTQTQSLKLKIRLTSLSILICFDSSPGQFSFLEIPLWNKIFNSIVSLLNFYDEYQKDPNSKKEEKENITNFLQNNLISILEKLEVELYKSLQFTDINSTDYYTRLKDDSRFLVLCKKIENFYQKINNVGLVARIYLIAIMHLYYKSENVINSAVQKFNIKLEEEDYMTQCNKNPIDFIKKLCDVIYVNLDDKSKLKATLCSIYFYSVRDHYKEAKKLFNMSYSYEIISTFKDEGLKTLFNRTVAQLGLCAFRDGKYQDSSFFLAPLCSNGTVKLKEYLSQSYNKEMEKSILFDKEDKKRAIPYIMTIDIDTIECVFYLTSMVIDTPYILQSRLGISKHAKRFNNFFFMKNLSNFEKQVFNGPPETNKERILSASFHILKGDWKKSLAEVKLITVINRENSEEINKSVEKSIKITAMKNYIVMYMKEYKSISADLLGKRFALDQLTIHNVVNDMIVEEEINAKWNKNTLKIVSDERDTSKMMKRLVENVSTITKQNLDLLMVTGKRKDN